MRKFTDRQTRHISATSCIAFRRYSLSTPPTMSYQRMPMKKHPRKARLRDMEVARHESLICTLCFKVNFLAKKSLQRCQHDYIHRGRKTSIYVLSNWIFLGQPPLSATMYKSENHFATGLYQHFNRAAFFTPYLQHLASYHHHFWKWNTHHRFRR